MKSFKDQLDDIQKREGYPHTNVVLAAELTELIRRFKIAEEAVHISNCFIKTRSPTNAYELLDEALQEISKPFGEEK
jgi:predicted metal-binding protein